MSEMPEVYQREILARRKQKAEQMAAGTSRPMTRWEYLELEPRREHGSTHVDWKAIDNLGQNGWEMVQMLPSGVAIFKRPFMPI